MGWSMARSTILLCLDLLPSEPGLTLNSHQILFKNTQNPLEAICNCIKHLQSIPSHSQVSFILISSILDISNQSNELVDGLLTLLLSIETFIKDFRFYWVSREEISQNAKWIEAFPYIEFIKLDSSSFSFVKSINLPLIGQIKVDSIELMALNLSNFISDSFKIVRKDHIKGFILDSIKSQLIPPKPIVPPKHQFNNETEGILFELKVVQQRCDNTNLAFIYMDLSENSITFIDPVYIWFIKKKYFSKVTIEKESHQLIATSVNKLLEKSFTEWPAEEESIDEDVIKKNNKLKLKKLILLSLRGIGIKKSDKQFMDVWKHLYCGCIFSLRKELNSSTIDQAILLKTIKENIKFLNL